MWKLVYTRLKTILLPSLTDVSLETLGFSV